jgi:GDP-fucose transporter C1
MNTDSVVKHRAVDRNVKIALAVAFYFTASMALVFLNKRMFSAVGKDFPLFVTWWQFVVALALIAVGGEVGKRFPEFKFFAPLEFKQSVAWNCLPVTCIFIGMVVFNNLCLKYDVTRQD